MTITTCPRCGHSFTAGVEDRPAPDRSVVEWFRADVGWSGELSADEVYGNYLRACDTTPVARTRFLADLAYLGVEQVLDDDTVMMIRS